MFTTKSGKIEFSHAEAYAVGEMKAVPTWIEPAWCSDSRRASLRLITGDQVFQDEDLHQDKRQADPDSERLRGRPRMDFLLACRRARIADGDTVELSNENARGCRAGARDRTASTTTQPICRRITAARPRQFARRSDSGASHKALVTRQAEPESGAGMLQGGPCEREKVGA